MNGRTKALWALLVAGVSLTSCEEGAPVATLTADLGSYLGADGVTIRGEHVFLNAEGIRASRLRFDTMYQWSDSTENHLRGLELQVFTETGAERAHLTSDRGTMDPRGESMIAEGNVVLVIPAEGRRLESEHLYYEPESERISSEAPFVMTFQGREFRGNSFISDIEFRNFQSTGPGG